MNSAKKRVYMKTLVGLLAALFCCSARTLALTPADVPTTPTDADTAFSAPPTAGPGQSSSAWAPQGPGKWVEKKIEDRLYLFVFAAIGDSHLRVAGSQDTRYMKDMEKCQELLANYVSDINTHVPSVDFAVHLGDLTDLGKPEEFAMATSVMNGLTCPLHPVLGNHDNFQSDHKQGWKAFAGLDSTSYVFDLMGFHFIVLDCTLDPYAPPYVDCGATLREWVTQDLARNSAKPAVVLSHFNMWQRPWNAMFDTTLHYAEYRGMPELRQVLEDAGNVVAVVNGHVHANRVEEHNGIYYVDVGATLVGPPSIRYFYVYPDRIEVTYAYISDQNLLNHATALCPGCCCCFNKDQVCAFIDGQESDKRFVIPLGLDAAVPPASPDSRVSSSLELAVRRDDTGHIRAFISSELMGVVDISVHDVLGRRLGRCNLWKDKPDFEADLSNNLAGLSDMPAGIYFIRASFRGTAVTRKFAFLP